MLGRFAKSNPRLSSIEKLNTGASKGGRNFLDVLDRRLGNPTCFEALYGGSCHAAFGGKLVLVPVKQSAGCFHMR